MFDRIVPVYDPMNRVMTAGLDQRWRRLAAEAVVRPGDRRPRRVLRHRGSRSRLRSGRRSGDRARFLRADARAGAPQGSVDRVGARRPARPAFRARRRSTRPRSGSACATSPTSRPAFESWAACCGPGDVSPASRSRGPRGRSRRSSALWFDGLVPLVGSVLPGGEAYTYLPASVRRFPGPKELAALLAQAGFTEIRWTMLGGGIVALHTATAAEAA